MDKGTDKGSGIIRGMIHQKKIVYLILFLLIAIGIAGLSRMNKDEFPTFEIKQGLVAGVYPGASAKEVEEQLTKPLEDILFSFSEVNRETTYSYSKDGICYIYVDLTVPAKEKDEAWSKIKLRLDAAKMTLPPGVLAVAVVDNFSSVSALLIALESADKSYREMQEYAEDLSERLKSIPATANVSIVGTQNEEIAVTVDMDKLSAYGISPSALMLNYQTSGLQLLGGTFKTGYAYSPIHVKSLVASEEEIANHIVYVDPGGNSIRLKDIARIERRYKEPSSLVKYNGHTALILSIEMRPDNNIVAFGEEVDKVLAEFSTGLPESVTMSRITDQPKVVGSSVYSFLRDLLISMAVVIFVMLMLFPMRSALIASSGVPVCTAVALALMYLFGIDLNTVTLASLIVVLGMIVDDSIITMDGYMNYLGQGYSRIDAACASAKELFMPMFMATTAICVMFFPSLKVITGYLGEFVSYFPWVVTIALGTSLAYAMLVVPSLEVRFIGSARAEGNSLLARVQKRFFDGMQNGYERLQAVCFKYPRRTLLLGLGTVVLGVVFFFQLNIQMMPMAAREYFAVEIYLENNAGLEQTEKVADSIQRLLTADRRVKSVTSFIGTGAPRFNAIYVPMLPGSNTAQLIVTTSSLRATEALLQECQQKYEHLFPGALLRFKQMDYQAVTAPVAIELRGADPEVLKPFADSIRHFLSGMGDVLQWVHTDCDGYVSSIDISLDPDEASRLGINKSMVSLSLSGAFNGLPVGTVWEGEKSVPVSLYSEAVSRQMDYSVLENYLLPTLYPGVSVPLRQVAEIQPGWELESYPRKAGESCLTVTADMKYECSQPEAMKHIKAFVESHIKPNLPEGARVEYAGLSAINKDVGPEIMMAFICAVAVLFFFLLFHFKKISIAALTLVLSVLCFFGAFLGLWLFRLDFGLTAVLGLISLVGIIVRNGIIMFEYAEELRFERGMPLKEAAEEAGKRRMRPIFLTSCTTALGVLPMILSGDFLWKPMGVVICFGTMLSIILIVLIMPVSYWQIFQIGEKRRMAKQRNFGQAGQTVRERQAVQALQTREGGEHE